MSSADGSGPRAAAHRRSPDARDGRRLIAVLAAGALLVGAFLLWIRPGSSSARTQPRATTSAPATGGERAATVTPTAPAPTGAPPGPAAPDTASPPVSISIPAIGVQSPLQALGLLRDGSLQPPSRWEEAGWYARGVVPGSTGPAVIAGHVDSVSGPAVFFRLRELRVGDQVRVTRRDHRVLTFVVDDVQSYPKAVFPTQAVYGPTPLPVLRLVTCTGDFDYRAHSYLDNLVVSAHLA